MPIQMGGRYQLVKHPNRPIGIARSAYSGTKEILVEWEDKGLIPQSQRYPEEYFSDGTFEYLGYMSAPSMYGYGHKWESGGTCIHEWSEYIGFNEFYEFCKKCDVKKEKEKDKT